MLWQKREVFWCTTSILMLRFNNGRKFIKQQLREIKIESEKAFERVMVEVMGQLCSWLEYSHCRKDLKSFFYQVFRFKDVIPNYFTALISQLNVNEALY
jgi:hypothetical protein